MRWRPTWRPRSRAGSAGRRRRRKRATAIEGARRRFLGALAVVAGLGAATALGSCRPDERPRNLVLIVVDTLRQDRLASYGYARETAPTLDRLAREGVAADGLAPSSWTKPVTASLLTGLHPLRHRAVGRDDALPEAAVTLAEVLTERGYATLGISANPWVGETYGLVQGFETFLEEPGKPGAGGATAAEVNAELLPRLVGLREPFFLYVHYLDPHTPYDPVVAWDGGPLPAELAARAPMNNADLVHPLLEVDRPDDIVAAASDLYDGEIRTVDRGITALLVALEEAGLSQASLTVVTSDHGEELEDHGRMTHGHSLYSELVRVPLIFHAPGFLPAGHRLATTSLLDVVPTVLELLGLEPLADLDGHSVAGSLKSAAGSLKSAAGSLRGQPAATENPLGPREHLLHLDFDDGVSLAWIDGASSSSGLSKLVLGKFPYRKELYDLGADPGEEVDLLATESSTGPALTWRPDLAADLARAYGELSARALEPREASLDAEKAGRLRSLGYAALAASTYRPALPRRIRSASPEPLDFLGWERRPALPCLDLSLGKESQLLAGWHRTVTRLGRWTEGSATMLLGYPQGASPRTASGPGSDSEGLWLILSGSNPRPAPVELQATAAGRALQPRRIPQGAFELGWKLTPKDLGLGSAWLLKLETPPFRPQDEGAEDPRTLGILLKTVCIQTG